MATSVPVSSRWYPKCCPILPGDVATSAGVAVSNLHWLLVSVPNCGNTNTFFTSFPYAVVILFLLHFIPECLNLLNCFPGLVEGKFTGNLHMCMVKDMVSTATYRNISLEPIHGLPTSQAEDCWQPWIEAQWPYDGPDQEAMSLERSAAVRPMIFRTRHLKWQKPDMWAESRLNYHISNIFKSPLKLTHAWSLDVHGFLQWLIWSGSLICPAGA